MIVARTKENLHKCRCKDCPSYTTKCKIKNYPMNMIKMMDDLDDIEHFEGLFCAFEKSNCIEEDFGCLCEDCPIHKKYNLLRDEYCLRNGGEIPLVVRGVSEGAEINNLMMLQRSTTE